MFAICIAMTSICTALLARCLGQNRNRVEHAIVIGTQKELPTRAGAREFVKSLYLPINHPAPNNNGRPVTFSDIAGHYIQEELSEDQNQASAPKAYSTTATYRRYLRKWVLPRWGDQAALLIAPQSSSNQFDNDIADFFFANSF